MWQDSTFENTKMHYSQKCGRCARQRYVADTRGRRVWQTRVADMQSKTSDTIAAAVKDDFPLTLLQLL